MSRVWELIKAFFAWLFLDKPRDITKSLKEGAEEVKEATEEAYKETKEEVSEWAGKVKKAAEELGHLVVSSKVLEKNGNKLHNKNKNVQYYPKSDADLDETIHPVKAKKMVSKKTKKKVAKKPVKKIKKAPKKTKKSTRAPKKTK